MTSLQKQLAAIAASSTHQLDLKAQKTAHGKSLLYEPKVAASQSFDSIYLICHEGYRDLCALDHRFLPFARTLFSEQSKTEDRTEMTKKENGELNSVLEAFMTLLGPKLLLKPAEKALEWLVRRFRVHDYNTECLVLTYLPYHATPQFLALLSILPPSPSPTLRFLFPYITPPTNPPRSTVVYTAVNTPAFFTALQGYVVKALQAGHAGSSLITFWSSITTQAIDAILDQSNSGRKEVQDQRTEELLLRVLPALNECLNISHVSEAVMGCYMIIIVLVTKGSFEDKVLDSLMEAVVRSRETETLDGCLMCLAVIAEERSHSNIPTPVLKRLFSLPELARSLTSISNKCRVERLALGCTLGALESIGRAVRSEECCRLCQDIVESELLDDAYASLALSALLRHVRESSPGSAEHSQLLELVGRLSESAQASRILQKLTQDSGAEYEKLGISFQLSMEIAEPRLEDIDDEEMLDVDQDPEHNGVFTISPPTIKASSFLVSSSNDAFEATLTAFEQAVASKAPVGRFLSSKELRRDEAFTKPLFLSFLARTWSAPASALARVAAIRSMNALVKSVDGRADMQVLIPYLMFALADPSPAVRRAAARCLSTLSSKAMDAEKESKYSVWGATDVYGKDSSRISFLPKGQTSQLLSSILIPVLEECVMDSKFIVTSTKAIFEGAQPAKNASGHNLKSSTRASLISFLASHAALTPVLRVRLYLLSLFNFHGKSTGSVRTSTILPVIRSWCFLPTTEAVAQCTREKYDVTEADKQHLAALVAREPESVDLLKDMVSGHINKERITLQDAVFHRLNDLWPSLRSESRLSMGQCLLELALKEKCASRVEEVSRTRSLETLRTVSLDTAVLANFLENVPSAIQMAEGPPTKKRRRTSRNEMARMDAQSPEDITKLLRRLTLVLELIEGSNPGEHLDLFKPLFAVLNDLQQLKQQSGSDLVYLQSLVLNSLMPIADRLKTEPTASEFQAAVRVDLLIDCIRHSTSPQVQYSALLLIASLASWVPELVLHNLMPIFTFMGSTLLRQQDDYSAHVVDQTISRVVPQLATSLRARHKDFLTGVADLLLSFTAAFEHIPHHRRLKLFSELAQTLGPSDSLSAIIALLIDRYPTSTAQRKFVPELLLKFEPTATLEAFRGYLGLVADAVGSKRKIADTLFSLNEKASVQVDNSVNNLLSSLADLATDKSVQRHVSRAFRKGKETSKPRALCADIVEATITLSKKASGNQRVYDTCSRVLANCLDLLPTTDLIKSAELLLSNPDNQVQVAALKSVEVRAGAVTQNDQPSVSSLLSFLEQVDGLLQQSEDVDVKIIAVSCIDRIVERFGKKDASTVSAIGRTITGPQALSSEDDRVRILSLLCLTSIVDVLEEEAISLLPAVLPRAFEYLKESINRDKQGLHNAVFALLSNIVERLAFMFSREYLVPALELAQHSAASDLGEACDESRRQFYQSVATHLGAKEVFTAIKATWLSAITQGYEAAREQLDLLNSTIENQTKSKIVQASNSLFGLILEIFDLRHAISERDDEDEMEDDEIEQLEASLIEATISMTLKLNDTTFRPFFVQLVDFASSTSSTINVSRSITFCKFLASFFDRFKGIVTSYSSYITEPLSQLLAKLDLESGEDADAELRAAVLSALKNSFAHDQDGFWQAPSHYGQILQPLLKQLTIDNALQISDDVIPAITELAAASSASIDNHREMNTVLLKYMRAEEAHTRLATVKCEQSLTQRLGEEWLALLPEMLPFISELREDDDEIVERETQRWITQVEEILGEDLEGMLQ